MNTPMMVLTLDSVRDRIPDDPGEHRHDDREHVGCVDQVRHGSNTEVEGTGREAGAPDDQAEDQ